MTEQEALKANVMSDPNILAFLVYADYLDENGLDSSMWREPYSPISKVIKDGGYGSGDPNGGSFGNGGDNGNGGGGGGGGGGYNHAPKILM